MRANTQRWTRLLMIGLGAILGGLVAGLGLVLVMPREQAVTPEAASMAQVTLSETPEPAASPTPEADPTVAAEPDAATTDDTTTRRGQVAACVEAAARADAAVVAARAALGDWKTHYGAQVAFDEGRIDNDEAKRRWATSKEAGPGNVDAFLAAQEALPNGDPCGGVDVAQLNDRRRRRVERCAARAAGVTDVLSAAQPALDDWQGHLEMMATRDQYATDEYLEIWRRTVAEAPGRMRPFERAATAYEQLAGCRAASATS